MKNLQLSKEIYNQLITGRYINKTIIDENDNLISNNLFNELLTNLIEYNQTYLELGYKIQKNDNYFYLTTLEAIEDSENNVDKHLLKEYVIIVVLFRFLLDNKIDMNKTLLKSSIGLNIELLTKLFEGQKYLNILNVLELKNIDLRIFDDFLVRRNILFKNSKGNLVLTDIGQEFLTYNQGLVDSLFNS